MPLSIAMLIVAGATAAWAADPLKTGPSVRALAFSPDDKYLAATSAEPEQAGHATVWEVASGKVRFAHKEAKGIPAAAFSPDGKWLVLGSFTENAIVIDTAKWAIDRRLPGHGKAARGVAFSHDGKRLAVTSYDGFVQLWDVPTWTLGKTLEKLHTNWVYAAAFSRDGKTLATCQRRQLCQALGPRIRQVPAYFPAPQPGAPHRLHARRPPRRLHELGRHPGHPRPRLGPVDRRYRALRRRRQRRRHARR